MTNQEPNSAAPMTLGNPRRGTTDVDPRLVAPHNDLVTLTWFTALLVLPILLAPQAGFAQGEFAVEETTIAELHAAIKSGDTTCEAVVQSYIERAQAYNGMCTALVTADGAADRAGTRHRSRRRAARVSDEYRAASAASCRTSPATRARPSSSAAWKRRLQTRPCSSSSACASAFPTPAS